MLIFYHLPIFSVNGSEKLTVAVPKNLSHQYIELFNQQQKSALNITDIDKSRLTPSMVQLIIIKQALLEGGLPVVFEFIKVPNEQRAGALLTNGDAVISTFIASEKSQPQVTYKSSTVLESGILKKGVYGLPSNEALMKIESMEDLKSLKGILVSSWNSDIETLENFGIKQLELVPKYQTIFTRIAYRNTDYTLLDFPYNKTPDNKPLIRYHNGIKLYPVPNTAIEIEGDRHFFISKKHPDGKRIFQALEKGLKTMKDEGIIEEYFRQINVIRDDSDHFKILNKIEK